MSHRDEVDLLRSRSLKMLHYAREAVERGDYDLAVFFAEQAAQLYSKSVILELTGEVPRTNSIRQLLYMIGDLVSDRQRMRIIEFVRQYRSLLAGLEDAYIASRYLYRRYGRDEALDLVRIAEMVIKVVKDLKVTG
ncbi:HEPN domain-containing protein [Staphylothermus hellenicus]|uniref:HEPN domain protein n=1 Tax=Staphylothermus hellenicus (strain DSM 12710 / JCM 10830 / BK20S6-10-b1 / P8) TaxID=591019 RepID=D7D8C4_STAHD|nr:HEPN domain-containing protein [Staphylothermus hellenicus]ADI32020.1 HEPN domain protein [Staphylothermus hellenicus DSM 12710]